MKVLPKQQDILKAKNDERKKEIDEGIALANRIDKLRETKTNEERQLGLWRENSIRTIQKEIDEYLTVKENLRVQTEGAEVLRRKLIEPLDEEWIKVRIEQAEIKKDREAVEISKASLKEQAEKLKIDIQKISDIVIRTKDNEEAIDKAKSEIIALKEMAQREYEIARQERETQTSLHEKALLEVRYSKEEYENGININKIKEKELQEQEADLIIREKELERRQKNFLTAQNTK